MAFTKSELTALLNELKKDIKSDMEQIVKNEITKLNLTTILQEQHKQIEELKQENKELKEKFKLQKNAFEVYRRQNNLIIYGAREAEREGDVELIETVRDICNNIIKVELKNTDINFVRRLGRRGGSARPILLSFTSYLTKIAVLKNSKNLKGSKIFIAGDYEPEARLRRNKLFEIRRNLIGTGKNAAVRGIGLIVDGNYLNYEDAVNKFGQLEGGMTAREEPVEAEEDPQTGGGSQIQGNPDGNGRDNARNIDDFFRPSRTRKQTRRQ
jgi:hypothetical protein